MIVFINLLCFTAINEVVSMFGGDDAAMLTAITDATSEYVQEFYHQLRNEGPPIQDSAAINVYVRNCICDEIFESANWSWTAFDENPIIQRQLEVPRTIENRLIFYQANEYVFTCLVRREPSGEIITFYVSKAYNVSIPNAPPTAGRFIFGNRDLPRREIIRLAEEPGTLYIGEDFNVETYYILVRSSSETENDEDSDPLCKLVSHERHKNQYNRICSKVLNSWQLRNREVKRHVRSAVSACGEIRVSFKTPVAIMLAGEDDFTERMIPCYYENHAGEPRIYYVSRGYKPYEVFLYVQDDGSADHLSIKELVVNMNIIA